MTLATCRARFQNMNTSRASPDKELSARALREDQRVANRSNILGRPCIPMCAVLVGKLVEKSREEKGT